MSRSKQIFAARFFRATGEFYTFYLDAIIASGLPQEFFNNALALQTKTITDSETERNQSAESGGCIEHPIKWQSLNERPND